MAMTKLMLVVLSTALLTACGSTPVQTALPGNGGYPDSSLAADGTSGPADPGAVAADPTPPGGDSTDGAPLTSGYVLKGIVTDKTGQPLDKAKVSIGAVTTLTAPDGTFSITGIMDSQVQVDVVKDGFQSILSYTVAFTPDKPSADKEFKLAEGSATSTDGGTSSTPDDAGFTLETSFSPKPFKSVSAMVVDGSTIYVLGVVDGFLWFNRNSVVAINAETGEAMLTMNKTGLLTHLPSDADSLKVTDGKVIVSNGKASWTFNSDDGSLIEKGTAAKTPVVTEAKDTEHGITYTLKTGNKVEAKVDGDRTTYALPGEVSSAKAIGVDDAGNLLVLDASHKVVHQLSFSH